MLGADVTLKYRAGRRSILAVDICVIRVLEFVFEGQRLSGQLVYLNSRPGEPDSIGDDT